jgi:ComF family protein
MIGLRDLVEGLLALAAPRVCASCRAPIADARERGRTLLDRVRRGLARAACERCRADLERARPRAGSVVLLRYRGAGRRLLRALKYEGRREVAPAVGDALGRLVARARPELARARPLVVPVPLHWTRRLARGFNQAERIAATLGPAIGGELAPRALARVRRTVPLYKVAREARAATVEGAFAADASVRGRVVVLVDDIRTSGATLAACAKALRAAGAGAVVSVAAAG